MGRRARWCADTAWVEGESLLLFWAENLLHRSTLHIRDTAQVGAPGRARQWNESRYHDGLEGVGRHPQRCLHHRQKMSQDFLETTTIELGQFADAVASQSCTKLRAFVSRALASGSRFQSLQLPRTKP